MITALRKYDAMKTVIERCNTVVLKTLEASDIREAKIAAESFRNGGKRLRPALMILTAAACSGRDGEEATASLLELAAAVELIHLATLFHDDVIDGVEERRTEQSARAKYGNYVSVLAGDYVLAEALLLVQRSGMAHTMPDFLETIRVLVSGESKETNHKFNFELDEETYLEIISEKSASLFLLSCKAGAIAENSEYAEVCRHFGWHLGMAFQMIDDLDDMLELPHGPADCDLRNGYFALPVIQVMSSLRDGHRSDLIDTIRRGEFTTEEQRRIIDLCNEHGGIRYAKQHIDTHLDRGDAALTSLPEGEARDMLRTIIADLKTYAATQVSSYEQYTQSES